MSTGAIVVWIIHGHNKSSLERSRYADACSTIGRISVNNSSDRDHVQEPPVGIHVVRVKVGFFSTTGLITYSIRARRVSFLVMDA
jgi:hypothetical protein